jgi:hypothetical protein
LMRPLQEDAQSEVPEMCGVADLNYRRPDVG